MAVEIAFENNRICNFEGARDLDLGSGHTACHRASLIDIDLHAKFHWNQRNFLWMDRRMYVCMYHRLLRSLWYVRMDGHFRRT